MAILNAKLPLVITHAPGHMAITDLRNEALALGSPGAGPASTNQAEAPSLPAGRLQVILTPGAETTPPRSKSSTGPSRPHSVKGSTDARLANNSPADPEKLRRYCRLR